MSITFTKILEYELYLDDPKIDMYDRICKILNHELNPITKKANKLIPKSSIVYCSPLRRAKDCIAYKTNTTIFYLDELAEIPFDLKKMCSRKNWESNGESVVRGAFKEAFIDDKLIISRSKIIEQIKKVLQLINTQNDITFISHSFRLSVIEAYISTNGKLNTQPNLIHKFIADNHKRYEFGSGFEIETNQKIIVN